MKKQEFSDIEEFTEQEQKELLNAVNSVESRDLNITVSPQRLKPDNEFCFVFLDPISDFLEGRINNVKLDATDIKIFFRYGKRMQFGNQIVISQQTIANDLGIPRQSVTRAVAKFIKAGVFYKEDNSLYMSWKFMAKGNLTEFIKLEREKKKQEKILNQLNKKKKKREELEKEFLEKTTPF